MTPRQLDCPRWLILGKTAEETGIILGISRQTVEHHINDLRKKFDCNNKSVMIMTLLQYFHYQDLSTYLANNS